MTKEIAKQLEDWKYIQGLSLDMLQMLSDEQLGFTVGKNMGTLGEQFRHMARVRLQYAEAIDTKKIGRSAETIDPAVAQSKDKLIALWQKASQKLVDIVEQTDSQELENLSIDWTLWGVDAMNIHDHLNALMDHETLHNGQIVVYIRTLGLKFPASWAAWGL